MLYVQTGFIVTKNYGTRYQGVRTCDTPATRTSLKHVMTGTAAVIH